MSRQLYVAWQSQRSRWWYAVGVLSYSQNGDYEFRYVHGANQAAERDAFPGIAQFPDFETLYRSPRLFSFFSNRIVPRSRPDYREILDRVSMPPDSSLEDPDYVFTFLSRTLGWRATDSFDMFEPLRKTDEGYSWECFTRGVSHLDEAIRDQWQRGITPANPIRPVLDSHNPHDETAVLLVDGKQRALGFIPRFYSARIFEIVKSAENINVEILRHNKERWLDQHRFLVKLDTTMPCGFKLSPSPDLEPIISSAATTE